MSEIYTGVKFNINLTKKNITYPNSIEPLKDWCLFYSKYQLAPTHQTGSFGNLSFRTNEKEIYITGTGIDLGNITNNSCFVKINNCDFTKLQIDAEGSMQPSSESMLHYYIYEKRPDINAIFHGHNIEICNKAIANNTPFTANEEPYGTINLVESASQLVKYDIFILKNHGFVVLGRSMEDAGRKTKQLLTL
jgi:ribulose-5-phosphate 4-epimerase/fuculose-1-phosphate aldolase